MKITIKYFASLREKAGKGHEEMIIPEGRRLDDIYHDLSLQYGFSLPSKQIKYSLNNEYVGPEVSLKENDVLVFIPPVAGG